ncbi:MAG: AmmeMemoRadiSam system protein B [Proteobacteria bacterium]|nr:AmmeMemoRadiSam system protein B [Pseudomonadota bacterium]MBU1741629.1 AmmeMemoRadiSam system protein B [Pseudomonadota bacterium]
MTQTVIDDCPRVRSLEVIPVRSQGRLGILLRDPQRLSECTIIVPENIFLIISLMDGRHTRRDIQEAYMRRYGELIYTEHIEKVEAELDQNLFLHSERFALHQARIIDEFAAAPAIEVTPAGVGDLPGGATLEKWLDECLAPSGRTRGEGRIKAVIAPHVDLVRGRRVYGAVYDRVRDCSPEALFVLLGTSHQPTRGLVVPTAKDFETPLGRVRTDREAAERLKKLTGDEGRADEIVHRTEHSIVFQILFLQHLLGPVRILPLLCGTFSALIADGKSPEAEDEVRRWRRELSAVLEDAGEVVIVAGADLAHIGPMFGDSELVDRGLAAASEAADRRLLDEVAAGNEAGFFRAVAAEEDRRRICGLAPIWWLLALTDAARGEIVDYEQWKDQAGQGSVSFAGLVFWS